MKALIATNQQARNYLNNKVINGKRVLEIKSDDQIFDVADELFWIDCDEFVNSYMYYWDEDSKSIKPIPDL